MTNGHVRGTVEFTAGDGDTRVYVVREAKGLDDGQFHPERLYVECDYTDFVSLMVNAGWLPTKGTSEGEK